MTLTRNLTETEFLKISNESQSLDGYHLTAKIANSQLGPRELSLLLEVLEYQIVHFGCNFAMLIALSEIYFRILGNKRKASEVNNGKIRTVVTVAEILLKAFGSSEFSLDSSVRIELEVELKSILSPCLMSKRTYGSRYKTWRPEKHITVKAVPVTVRFERSDSGRNERFSGYCKGYGESHGNAHRQKTRPSAELDGVTDSESSEERNLKHRVLDPEHQPANSLWIKFMNWLGMKL